MSEELPRYTRYNLMELLEAITGLDIIHYPDRAELIMAQIEERYPEAWSLLGDRMRDAVAANGDIPLKHWVEQLPPEVLAAGETVGDDDDTHHYEDTPDYGSYSASELLQALNSVDPAQYPERQDQLFDELQRRFPERVEAARKLLETKDR